MYDGITAGIRLSDQPRDSTPRFASNRNQVRRSASSIQFSSRLVVATSPCSSHRPCVCSKLAKCRRRAPAPATPRARQCLPIKACEPMSHRDGFSKKIRNVVALRTTLLVPRLWKGSRHCRFADHPTVSVTPVHSLVAIARNGWSRSIGISGRNPPVPDLSAGLDAVGNDDFRAAAADDRAARGAARCHQHGAAPPTARHHRH
jgi:hypothetical protein